MPKPDTFLVTAPGLVLRLRLARTLCCQLDGSERARRVRVAHRQRQCVGGVLARPHRQAQQARDHFLHLFLARFTLADDGFFYL